jgi:hypothetical protein
VSNSNDSARRQLLDGIEAEASFSRVVAPGLGYPNHSDALSSEPTGWLCDDSETRHVSRETSPHPSQIARDLN